MPDPDQAEGAPAQRPQGQQRYHQAVTVSSRPAHYGLATFCLRQTATGLLHQRDAQVHQDLGVAQQRAFVAYRPGLPTRPAALQFAHPVPVDLRRHGPERQQQLVEIDHDAVDRDRLGQVFGIGLESHSRDPGRGVNVDQQPLLLQVLQPVAVLALRVVARALGPVRRSAAVVIEDRRSPLRTCPGLAVGGRPAVDRKMTCLALHLTGFPSRRSSMMLS